MSEVNIFKTLLFIHKFCKIFGMAPYTLKISKYHFKITVTKTDLALVIFKSILLTSLLIFSYRERMSYHNDIIATTENYYYLATLFLSFWLLISLNYLFSYRNRLLIFQLLNRIDKFQNYLSVFNVNITNVNLRRFYCFVIFLPILFCFLFVLFDILMYPEKIFTITFYLVITTSLIVMESRIVLFLYIFLFCIDEMNRKTEGNCRFWLSKVNVVMLRKILRIHYELFEMCNIINEYMGFYFVRVFTTFVAGVCSAYWLAVWTKENRLEFLACIELVTWFMANFWGIFLVILYCESIRKQVSTITIL